MDVLSVLSLKKIHSIEVRPCTRSVVLSAPAQELLSLPSETTFEGFESAVLRLIGKSDPNAAEGFVTLLLSLPDLVDYELRVDSPAGVRWFSITSRRFRTGQPDESCVILYEDVTTVKSKEKQLLKLNHFLESMVEVSHSILKIMNFKELMEIILDKSLAAINKGGIGAFLIIDEENRLRMQNYRGFREDEARVFSIPLVESFYWLQTQGRIGKPIIFHTQHRGDFRLLDAEDRSAIQSVLSTPVIIEGRLIGFLNVDSPEVDVFDEHDIEMMEFMVHQIAASVKMHDLYRKTVALSRYDHLTGIANRSWFEEQFMQMDRRMQEHQHPYSVTIVDLNDLKRVNDTFGHSAGDLLLVHFVARCRELLASHDLFARLGGDEFVIVSSRSAEEIDAIMKSLLGAFEAEPLKLPEIAVACDFSYGVAQYPVDGIERSEVLMKADNRMYRLKSQQKAARGRRSTDLRPD